MIARQLRWPDFEAHGFTVAPSEPAVQAQDAAADLIRLLEPYEPMDVRFCTAWCDNGVPLRLRFSEWNP